MVAAHDPTVIDVWERLARFHRRATTEMDETLRGRFGHDLSDYDVLHQVGENDAPIRMGELAGRLLIANSSCNRIVGRLVDAGLLQRFPGEADRREVLVALTSEGRRLRGRMATVHTRDVERLVGAPLRPEERAALDAALRTLLDPSRSSRGRG